MPITGKSVTRLSALCPLEHSFQPSRVCFAASHMETRVVALLKRTDRVGNPNALRVRPGRKARRKVSLGTDNFTDKKPQRKAKRKVDSECIDEEEELHQVRTISAALQCAVGVCGTLAPVNSCAHHRDVGCVFKCMFHGSVHIQVFVKAFGELSIQKQAD
jgi:hypothetical protein